MVRSIWRFLSSFTSNIFLFTDEASSSPITAVAWTVQPRRKNAHPLVQDLFLVEQFVARTEMSIPRNVTWKGKLVGKCPFFSLKKNPFPKESLLKINEFFPTFLFSSNSEPSLILCRSKYLCTSFKPFKKSNIECNLKNSHGHFLRSLI